MTGDKGSGEECGKGVEHFDSDFSSFHISFCSKACVQCCQSGGLGGAAYFLSSSFVVVMSTDTGHKAVSSTFNSKIEVAIFDAQI